MWTWGSQERLELELASSVVGKEVREVTRMHTKCSLWGLTTCSKVLLW